MVNKISFQSFKQSDRYNEMNIILKDAWYLYEQFFEEIEQCCDLKDTEHLYIDTDGKIDVLVIP